MSFDRAVEHVERTINDEGFSILLKKSIDEMMRKKLGLLDYPHYTIILACAPQLAKMALDVSKDVGNLFPYSVAVYEDNSKVLVSHVSIMKVAAEIGLARASKMMPVIMRTSEKVRKVWDKL
jgi:uncharacterized protein (DUF302 family)